MNITPTFIGNSQIITPLISEPVYIGKLDDEASPSGLQWLHASYSGEVSEVVSDKEFDQLLQPDLQKGSIETEFCCGNCSNDE